MRYRPPGRYIVACINWSHPDAPHAAVFRVGSDGYFDFERYFPTWVEAVAFVDDLRVKRGVAWR